MLILECLQAGLSWETVLKKEEDYKKALNEYEKHFGPLNIYSAYNDKKWNWIDGPWPWEKES